MFKDKKKPLNANVTDTVIGEGSVFEGKITSEAGIRIEGQIVGNVECTGDVTVGKNGVVKSNISARSVILAGAVHGNVFSKEKLTLMSTGRLFGNASAPSLIIEEGAVFHGSSKMEGSHESESGVANAEIEPVIKPFHSPFGSSSEAI